MALIVETGKNVAGANSYVGEDDFDVYCEDRGYTVADGDTEAALIRATQYVDSNYGVQFPGARANGRGQSLEWPRVDATDSSGYEIAEDEIPRELKAAVCEAALREKAEPGCLSPDVERGGPIRQFTAGPVSIEFDGAAANQSPTVFTIIDSILSPIVGRTNQLTGRASRG